VPESVPTLNEAAVVLHEVFTAYVAAGFTRKEALQLCAEHLRTMMLSSQGDT
jgi:hypothetical protein